MIGGVAHQKEAHDRKAYIVYSERVEPEGVVVKSKPELKNPVERVPRKGAVKRHPHAQSRIVLPLSRVLVLTLEGLEEPDEMRYPEAPHRQRIGGKKVGKDRQCRLRAKIHH